MNDLNDLDRLIGELRTRDPMVAITLNPEQSAIAILRGKLAAPVEVAELRKSPHEYARRFIKENTALFGEIDEDTELFDARAITNRRGMTHVVFHQKHGDALVLGGTLSVHYGVDGGVYLVKSNLAYAIDVPKDPTIPADSAAEIAKEHAGAGAVLFGGMKPVLVVVDAKTLHQEKKEQRYYLCWQLAVIGSEAGKPADWFYFVDALDGTVLLRHSADRTGSGTGNYSGTGALNSEQVGVLFWRRFRLRDTVTSSTWALDPGEHRPVIHTYDDHGSDSTALTNYSEDADDNWDDVGPPRPPGRINDQGPEVDIHRHLGYAINYYYLTHGYNGWDGEGRDAKAHAHNEKLRNNAYWSPHRRQIYFADGDGDSGDPGATCDFMCPLDTVAHEYTHGIKYYFDILQTYSGETGALDEATSDLFACFIALAHPADDPWPWHHGRQYRLDGTVGRNLADPSRDTTGVVQYDATNNATKLNSMDNGFYPDHYSIRYTGADDDHGVHINCPIITHAMYLMMNGGTHRLSGITVTGIGVAPVEQMLFEVISTGLLTNTSDFADFRIAFIETCQTLYPDDRHYLVTVKTAFHAVGIGPGPDSTSSWLSLLLLDDARTLPSGSWLSLLLLDDAMAT